MKRCKDPYVSALLVCLCYIVISAIYVSNENIAKGTPEEKTGESTIYEQIIDLVSGDKWLISVDHGRQLNDPHKISFFKIDNRGKHLISEYEVSGEFLSTPLLSEDRSLVYTVWVGNYYAVRVYSLSYDNVHQVLEVGSKRPPSFICLPDGRQTLLKDVNELELTEPFTYDVYVVSKNGYKQFDHVNVKDLATIGK
jgi:hypothetical protein